MWWLSFFLRWVHFPGLFLGLHGSGGVAVLLLDLQVSLVLRLFSDYSKGFGGKYGVQTDRMDKVSVPDPGLSFLRIVRELREVLLGVALGMVSGLQTWGLPCLEGQTLECCCPCARPHLACWGCPVRGRARPRFEADTVRAHFVVGVWLDHRRNLDMRL